MRIIKPKGGGELHVVEKGEQVRGGGAKKRTKTVLKNAGYTLNDINFVIQKILALTFEQIRDLLQNKKATILEMSIARALQVSLKKGDLYAMETLLTRRFGKPKDTVQITEAVEIKDLNIDTVDAIEAAKKYREMMG